MGCYIGCNRVFVKGVVSRDGNGNIIIFDMKFPYEMKIYKSYRNKWFNVYKRSDSWSKVQHVVQ